MLQNLTSTLEAEKEQFEQQKITDKEEMEEEKRKKKFKQDTDMELTLKALKKHVKKLE